MFSFKRSLIALVGLLVLVGVLATLLPLVSRGQGNPNIVPPFGPRKFYVTQTLHNGSQALSACANGYHMASLWEILDPSNLRYEPQLGRTRDDSGFGPPVGFVGWIHTGSDASPFPTNGLANCNAWDSDDGMHRGTTVSLNSSWDDNGFLIDPWRPFHFPCNVPTPVWCVQD